MKNTIKRLIIFLALVSLVIIIFNIPTFIRVGVDGHYREIRMPLYVKWTQFIARHYEYERLSKEITSECKTDEEKAMAILTWTRKNLAYLPEHMSVYDDHILNIIIRGYAVPDQFQDVFTTLCTYSGIPAFFDNIYNNDHTYKCVLSFVDLAGKWTVFDAYRGIYFTTKDNKIASVQDIIGGRYLAKGADIDSVTIHGVPYREYLNNLGAIGKPSTLRAYKQMPIKRIGFEIKKLMGLEKDD